MLECIHFADVYDKLVDALKGTNCLKTNIGFKTPSENVYCQTLYGAAYQMYSMIFNDFPVIDHKFYQDKIFTYKIELKKTGGVIDFEEANKAEGITSFL